MMIGIQNITSVADLYLNAPTLTSAQRATNFAGEAGLLDRSTGRKRDARCDADVFEGQSAGATRRGLGPHWQEGRDKQGSEGRTERQDAQHLQVRSVDGEAVLASAA